MTDDSDGSFRTPLERSGKFTVPALQLTISAADYNAWAKAAQIWFVDGKHQVADEMAERIVPLGLDLSTEPAIISFADIGFRRFQTIASTVDRISRFSVTTYMEAMSLKLEG